VALKECRSLDEALREIEGADERLVRLLALRRDYARQAARLGGSPETVQAFSRVRNLAKINGLDPDAVETIYRALLDR
jgi:chorismate mutase